MLVDTSLCGSAHLGRDAAQRLGQLGHRAAQPTTEAVLDDEVRPRRVASHWRAACKHGLQQAHAEDLLIVQIHKSIAGMIINVYRLVGQLGDHPAAGG